MKKDVTPNALLSKKTEIYSKADQLSTIPSLMVKPNKVFATLTLIILGFSLINIALLLLMYFAGNEYLFQVFSTFNLDAEDRLPAYFATGQIFVCAGILFLISLIEQTSALKRSKYWLGLSVVFLFLAMDELLSIHERLNAPLQQLFDVSGFLAYPWIAIYGLLVIVLFFLFSRFLLELPAGVRSLILIAGGVYILGAIGVESIQAYYGDAFGNASKSLRISSLGTIDQFQDLAYHLVIVVEETLELIGISLFLRAILFYVVKHFNYISIQSE